MSITLVKSYFNARAQAVGLHEHKDAFNEDDVPSNKIHLAFHVLLGSFSGVRLNQTTQEIDCPVTLTFWIDSSSRSNYSALDAAVQKSEDLLKEVLKNSNRLGQCLKNVVFNNMKHDQLSVDNLNVIKVTMNFTAFTSILIT